MTSKAPPLSSLTCAASANTSTLGCDRGKGWAPSDRLSRDSSELASQVDMSLLTSCSSSSISLRTRCRDAESSSGAASLTDQVVPMVAPEKIAMECGSGNSKCRKVRPTRRRRKIGSSQRALRLSPSRGVRSGELPEVIEEDALLFDPEIVQHFLAGLDHHRRSAEVVLHLVR